MIITYVAWGNKPSVFMEAAFSLLTYLPDPDVERICVIAEMPEFFQFAQDRIDLVPVSTDEFVEWTGPEKFMYRKKMKGIQRAIERYPGKDILFLDTDTFRGGAMRPAREFLDAGRLVMADNSGYLSKLRDRNNRHVWRSIQHKTIAGYRVTETTRRFNSGIVGLPAALAPQVIENAIDMVDEVYRLTDHYYGCEEIALSLGMQHHGDVADIGTIVGHYWGNKRPWDDMIAYFFAAHATQASSLDALIAAAGQVDFTAIPTYTHTPRRHKQLKRLAERFWPLCRIRHFPDQPPVCE